MTKKGRFAETVMYLLFMTRGKHSTTCKVFETMTPLAEAKSLNKIFTAQYLCFLALLYVMQYYY